MYRSNLSGIIKIPQSGAEFYTLAGPGKIVATVLLAPGGGLSKRHRRLAEAHEVISCTIRADFENPPSPDAFHRTTLRWAIYSADHISIWSAPFPQRADDFWEDSDQAVNGGKRFLTTVETNEERAPEWAAFIQRWKRKATLVRVYGPENAGGVQ